MKLESREDGNEQMRRMISRNALFQLLSLEFKHIFVLPPSPKREGRREGRKDGRKGGWMDGRKEREMEGEQESE